VRSCKDGVSSGFLAHLASVLSRDNGLWSTLSHDHTSVLGDPRVRALRAGMSGVAVPAMLPGNLCLPSNASLPGYLCLPGALGASVADR
jgi:hypothetical protein